MKPTKQDSGLSLCPNCNCMTKTIKGKCGKCGKYFASKDNYDDHQPQTVGVELPDPIDKQIDEIERLFENGKTADGANMIQHLILQEQQNVYKYLLTYMDGRIKNFGRTKHQDDIQAHLRQKFEELKRGSDG